MLFRFIVGDNDLIADLIQEAILGSSLPKLPPTYPRPATIGFSQRHALVPSLALRLPNGYTIISKPPSADSERISRPAAPALPRPASRR